MTVQTGLARLLSDPQHFLGDARVGLVANPTTVTHQLVHAIDALQNSPNVTLCRLFGPEHGLRATGQYMETMGSEEDPSGLPVRSLYGHTEDTLTPQQEDLHDLDVLLFDIQDVGVRYYTYAATMALCMRAARQAGIKVLVLDRPNPIGGTQVEGGGLEPGLENFCGLYPVPQRHGLTVGELARLYNTTFDIGCCLEVVACEGWRREHYFDQTQLPWVLPSPNMPTLDTAVVYAGMCLLEGTNISEGRGTTRPFEIFGAPYIDPRALAAALAQLDLPGVQFRACAFVPTFDKFAGEMCGGVQLHIRDRSAFMSYRTGLAVLWAVRQLWPKHFGWRSKPYEFRTDTPAIDLLCGTAHVREHIDAGASFETLLQAAYFETPAYTAGRAAALLY